MDAKKARGRPPNPYTARNPAWKPGHTRTWFRKLPTIAEPSDYLVRVYTLLLYIRVPTLRRVIEALLVFDHAFQPEAVTTALNHLRRPQAMMGMPLRITKFKHGLDENDLYSWGGFPTPFELKYLHAAYKERTRTLSKGLLRRAGERYVRALLIRSKKYSGLTQERQLGVVKDAHGRNALDIVAVSKDTGIKYGISVKNQREWLTAGDEAIKDCYSKATAHGARPWLFVAFATNKAQERCLRDGIRLTVLGRKIVPAEDDYHRPMKLMIEKLRCVLGPQPFEYLYSPASRTFKRSSAAKRDVNLLAGDAI